MNRILSILFSFFRVILIPLVYVLVMSGDKGLIKKLDQIPTDTNGKAMFYSIVVSSLSIWLWVCRLYIVLNIFLLILNFIPGVAK